jgi:predicted nucleotidyltransferase
MNEQFSPDNWRAQKYDGEDLVFLTPEETQLQLQEIQTNILQLIDDKQQEFREDLGAEYDIVGVLVFGSWARGDVHTKSDVDIYTIATEDPGKLSQGLADALSRRIKREVNAEDSILTSNMSQIQEIREGKDLMIKKDYLVITANPEINDLFSKKVI